ncbi:MAG: zinc ribbon domain-containing protein [Oscillospiraceae bacterium]|nr:zinc ribbon domain-containing protein [Oscillospiraceae bacterium]
MNCMKCGREISDGQAFCPGCLERMAQCPVKPDVVVQLPRRQEELPKKPQPRKKMRTPEEQIQRLKRKNRWLTAIACLLLASTLALGFLSIDFFRQLDVQKFLGQNYSTVETVN